MPRIPFAKSAPAAALAALAAAPLAAKPLDLQIGARAFGMGGAFAAVSDDATAAYWNPAGLAQIGSLTLSETNWMLQDISGLNINYFTVAIPISHVGTVAGGWLMQYASLAQGEPGTALHSESDWYEHTFSLAAGRELWSKLWIFERTSVGFSLDRYVLNSGEENGAGTGFDLGLLTRFPRGIRLGLVMRSLGADMMGDKLDPEFRLGLGYVWENPNHRAVAAFDLATKENVEYLDADEGVARNYKGFFGAEYTFRQEHWSASARAGVNSGFLNSRDMTAYTGGVGAGFRGFSLEYAYQYNVNEDLSLGQSHRVTLEVRLAEFLKRNEVSSRSAGSGTGIAPAADAPPAEAAPAAEAPPAEVGDLPMGEEPAK